MHRKGQGLINIHKSDCLCDGCCLYIEDIIQQQWLFMLITGQSGEGRSFSDHFKTFINSLTDYFFCYNLDCVLWLQPLLSIKRHNVNFAILHVFWQLDCESSHAHCRPSGISGAALTADGKHSMCISHIHYVF